MTDQSTCFEEIIIKEEFSPQESEDEDTRSCKESDFKLDLDTPEAYESFIFNLDDQYKQVETFNREENGLPPNVMGLYIKNLYILHKFIPITDGGSNLFDALSFLIFKNLTNTYFVRSKIVKHITDNWEMYKDYAVNPADQTPFNSALQYLEQMLKITTRGGGCELLAAAKVFDLRFELFVGENRSFFCGTSNFVRRIKVSPLSGQCHFDPYVSVSRSEVLKMLGVKRTVWTQTDNDIILQNNEYIKAVEQHLLKLIFPEVEGKKEKTEEEVVSLEPYNNYLNFATVFLEETPHNVIKRGRSPGRKVIAVDFNNRIIRINKRGRPAKRKRAKKQDPHYHVIQDPPDPAIQDPPDLIIREPPDVNLNDSSVSTRSLRYRTIEIPLEPEQDESEKKPTYDKKKTDESAEDKRPKKSPGRPRKRTYFNFQKNVILPQDLCNVQIKSELEENPTVVVDINFGNENESEGVVEQDEQLLTTPVNDQDDSEVRIKIEPTDESLPSSSHDQDDNDNAGNDESVAQEESPSEPEDVPKKVVKVKKGTGKPKGRPRKKRVGRKRKPLMYTHLVGKSNKELENIPA